MIPVFHIFRKCLISRVLGLLHASAMENFPFSVVPVILIMGERPFCASCDIGYGEFFHKYFGETKLVIDLAQEHGLILNNVNCQKCQNPCRLDYRPTRKDFRCDRTLKVHNRKKRCNFSLSVFINTWFSRSHIDIETNVLFVNLYLRDYFAYQVASDELKLSHKTITDWASFCREVLVSWALKNSVEQIGGEGEIVEIDESKFGKTKYNVGRVIQGQWVFGGVCRNTRDFFMVPVETRDAKTLLAIIKDKIKEGTTIISDCWKSYDCLSQEGFQHLTVNHSMNFVDPKTAAHTNTIERRWREAKAKVPRFGRRKYHFVGYLARALFLMRYQEANRRFHHFLEAAAALYPPH